jgi:hypothetical protein
LKSSVEEEESNFFMTHQKKLNKEIFAILGKQKKQIVRVKAELQISDGPDGGKLTDRELRNYKSLT